MGQVTSLGKQKLTVVVRVANEYDSEIKLEYDAEYGFHISFIDNGQIRFYKYRSDGDYSGLIAAFDKWDYFTIEYLDKNKEEEGNKN
jgi:hypothetical protein